MKSYSNVVILNWRPFEPEPEPPPPAPLDAISFVHSQNEHGQPCLYIDQGANTLIKKEMSLDRANQVAAAFGKELHHS